MRAGTIAFIAFLTACQVREPGARSFALFAARLEATADSAARRLAVDSLVRRVRESGGVLAEDSALTMVYRGSARAVFIAGDLNGWNPGTDGMRRIPGTDLFYRTLTLDPATRFEYKLVVDSVWMLDPLNPLRAPGGFGENSEVRMPHYRFPAEALPRSVPHGTIDTMTFTPRGSGTRSTVYVYLPPGYRPGSGPYPLLFVTDGGEYLSLAGMNVILDNLIAGGDIVPIVAAFIDPKTDPPDARTNARMAEYDLNDAFVGALADELRPMLRRRYGLSGDPAQTGIMGASMGGLIATYAAFRRPDAFGLCAAQSPSYQRKNDTLIALIRVGERRNFRMYLCTGTIRDAQKDARIVRDIMREKGYDLTYSEYPESHNWMNWRARIAEALMTFWGKRR